MTDGPETPRLRALWQPIETAPKDGKALLMTIAGKVPLVAWWVPDLVVGDDAGFWRGDAGYRIYPSHWMPLPELPSVLVRAGAKEPDVKETQK